MSKWRSIYYNGARLRDLGILPDGTLHNPNGYPDDVVKAAVLSADQQRHDRRSRAAKEAAKAAAIGGKGKSMSLQTRSCRADPPVRASLFNLRPRTEPIPRQLRGASAPIVGRTYWQRSID